jgi:DHA2 family multidrug resistance protein
MARVQFAASFVLYREAVVTSRPVTRRAPGWRANPWLVLATVIIGVGMPLADTTITNVGRYFIVGGLGITPFETGWLTAGYSLALAVGIPLSHRLRGFLEERDLYSLSLLVFMAGSVIMASSDTFGRAMAGRGLEGLAGGILLPLAPILIQESFPAESQPVALSLFSLAGGVWVTLGPTIGGLLIDNAGWRWAFWINIPIGCVALFLAQAFLKNHPRQDPRRFDGIGFLLFSGAMGFLFTGYMSAEWYGWHSDWIIGLFAVGLSLFFLFWLWSALVPDPILPPEVFRKPAFALLLSIVFLQFTASFGRLYLLAPFLERNYRFQAHHAGALVAVGAVAEFLVSLSFLVTRVLEGRWAFVLCVGAFLVAVANMDYLFLPANVFNLSLTVGSQLVFGAGLALTQVALPGLTRSLQPAPLIRASNTYLLVFQFLGGAWGTMICRHLILHVSPVFYQALSQTSAPRPGLASGGLFVRLAQAFTYNVLFFGLGLAGLAAVLLTVVLALFVRKPLGSPELPETTKSPVLDTGPGNQPEEAA